MSNLITRTYTFTDGTTAYGSQVDSEIANIVNTLNSLDQAGTTWTNIKVTTLLPQADVNFGGHKGTNLATPGSSGDAVTLGYLQSTYTTTSSLAGTRILQTVQATGGAQVTTTGASYVATNITASITPASTSSKVKISVSFTGFVATSSSLVYTIKRGSTDLGDSVGGFGNFTSATAGTLVSPICSIYLDSPSSASSLTYTVYIKNFGGAGTGVGVPGGTGPSSTSGYGTPTILLEEIG